MKKTIELNGTQKQINTAIAVLTAMGIIANNDVAETTTTEPKKEAETANKEPKFEDFKKDYVSVAKQLGCWSKKRNKCWQGCRTFVYSVIGWHPEDNPKMTLEEAKTKVKAFADEHGWKLSNE